MSENRLLIILLFVLLLSPCAPISGQSFMQNPALDINKKEADEALTDSLCVFTCQQNHLADSIFTNLFGQYTTCKTLPIAITHRRYGDVPPEIDMSFNDFICMFMDDFDFYCTIDEHKGKKVRVTLVLRNRVYDYIHMMLIDSTRQEISKGNVRMNADFYTYIPQHNVINYGK